MYSINNNNHISYQNTTGLPVNNRRSNGYLTSTPVNYSQQVSYQNTIPDESNIEYIKTYDKYIQLCSNDRDISTYPQTNSFKLGFEKIKNVSEVELISVILPNQNNILLEPYLILEINELPSNIEFTSTNVRNAFAILPLKKPNKDTDSFVIPELGHNYKTVLRLKTPISSIQSFTINIKDLNGDLFNFGDDSGGPAKALQTTFVFRIKYLEKDFSPVSAKAIF